MSDPMDPKEPLPENGNYETVRRHFLLPFGRQVRPKRRIPHISRKPGQNLRQYMIEVLFEDGLIYVIGGIILSGIVIGAVYNYAPEFMGDAIFAFIISLAGSSVVVSHISKEHQRTLVVVAKKDHPVRLRNSKDEKGEITTDFISEQMTGAALYHFYDWQVGKSLNFENVTNIHGDYGDIAFGAYVSPDGFTSVGQSGFRENITTALDYFERMSALTKQQKKVAKLAKKHVLSDDEHYDLRLYASAIDDLIKKYDSILTKVGAGLQTIDGLKKKEKQYILGVRTMNEKALKELEDWEREPRSLHLLREERVLANEVLLQSALERMIVYQHQHESDIRSEAHILEEYYRMNRPEDIAARIEDKRKLYKTSRTIFDVELANKAGGDDDREE